VAVENIADTPSLVTWLDLHGATVKKAKDDTHTAFDVCSGRHCKTYKGILGIDAHEVRQAVDETWGTV
jgi:peptidoglycan hydrolase-like amidase